MIKLEVNGTEVKGKFKGKGIEVLRDALRLEWTLRKTLKKNDMAAYMVFCDAVNDPDFLDSMEVGSERNKSESKKEKFEDLFKKLMEELDEEA